MELIREIIDLEEIDIILLEERFELIRLRRSFCGDRLLLLNQFLYLLFNFGLFFSALCQVNSASLILYERVPPTKHATIVP